MRLFTAVDLPEPVRDAVHAAAAPLRGTSGCRTVPAADLHVTVRFLGAVPGHRLPRVCAAIGAAVARWARGGPPQIRLRCRGSGVFPDARRPRVIWAGVDAGDRRAADLERAVSAELTPLGFPPEDRPWTPHVTVARVADPRRPSAGRIPSPPFELAAGPWFDVPDLVLYESVGPDAALVPSGSGPPRPGSRTSSRYRVVERFPLSAAPPPVSARGPSGPRAPTCPEDPREDAREDAREAAREAARAASPEDRPPLP